MTGTGLGGGEAVQLSAAELQHFMSFLYRRTGMHFGKNKQYYIDRRVADRVAATQSRDFADYFALLRSDAAELEIFINAFTVNETYFYREEHQLLCLSKELLPLLTAGKIPGDRVRIWSAACSTGEEPYSIAIWLLENWRMVDAFNVEIVGSDIDTRALCEARAGWFGPRALAKLSPPILDDYFEPRENDQQQIIQDLRESVIFTPVNLIDAASVAGQGLFDVIFCRNVLIYFDDASRRAAAENLRAALRPGGFLCLGHSESMTRIRDDFETCRFEDAIVYRKPVQDG